MRLSPEFFERDTVLVARELIGKYLVRRKGRKIVAVMITETEAYCGEQDKACHASKGFTPRTKVLYGKPGSLYVYLIYGMYHCLNFVTEREGYPAAVLIRGVDVVGGNGPGKLCRILSIDRTLHGLPAENNQLWIEDRGAPLLEIQEGKRIGIDYAGEWKDKLWRFTLQK